jgi:hypothetical protein
MFGRDGDDGVIIAELFGGGSREREKLPPMPIVEAQIMTLQEIQSNYARSLQGCPYKPGDVLRMRKSGTYTRGEQPVIVLETRKLEGPSNIDDDGSNKTGVRNDMRIAVITESGGAPAYWVESWQYEPWE